MQVLLDERGRATALRARALARYLAIVGVMTGALVLTGATPRRHLPRPMVISSVEPSEGPISGGTVVTIRGGPFPAGGVEVRFGEVPAATVAVVSPSEVRATTPPSPNGYATVRVEAGARSALAEFLFLPPTLEEIHPGDITTVAGIGLYIAEGRPARAAPILCTGDVALDIKGNILIAEKEANLVHLIDSAGIIHRFAGTGFRGGEEELGDGGPAREAVLDWPSGLAVGPAGDVYVAEQANHRIRKIDGLTGVIMTIAGSGGAGLPGGGFAGDGGPATGALLKEPNQVALDPVGNVYVLDAFNTRIRRISPDGIITTVAGTGERGFSGDGGPATQARFDVGGNGDSGSLKSDPDGNLFLVDDNNLRVRRIDAATGIITTVAGGGTRDEDGVPATTASFNQPFGIALDGEGNLFVTEFTRIRRVDSNGIITTVYGGLTAGTSPDGTPRETGLLMRLKRMTHDPIGNRLLFFEGGTIRLRAVDLGTGVLTTVAGIGPSTLGENGRAIAAEFDAFRSNLAVDSAGNVLLATEPSGRLRRLEVDGTLRTIAGGSFQSGVNPEPVRPALGHWIAIRAVTVGADDEIYVAEAKRVGRITTDGTYHLIAGGYGEYGYAGDGGPALGALFDNLAGVALDAEGNIFVIDGGNHCIRRIDARTGIITRFAGKVPPHPPNTWVENRTSGDGGPALDAEFSGPDYIAIDHAGNVYVSDWYEVRMIDRNGIIDEVLDRDQFGCGPGALATDSAGRVYVSCDQGQILRIDGPNVATTIVRVGPGVDGFGGDCGPAELALWRGGGGMAIDARGNVYLNDFYNRRIRAIREVVK